MSILIWKTKHIFILFVQLLDDSFKSPCPSSLDKSLWYFNHLAMWEGWNKGRMYYRVWSLSGLNQQKTVEANDTVVDYLTFYLWPCIIWPFAFAVIAEKQDDYKCWLKKKKKETNFLI